MSASPFQFITRRYDTREKQQFLKHEVRGPVGRLESGLMDQPQVQALIAEHLKAIDELSGTETVAMIRLPEKFGPLRNILEALQTEQTGELLTSWSGEWLMVWKK